MLFSVAGWLRNVAIASYFPVSPSECIGVKPPIKGAGVGETLLALSLRTKMISINDMLCKAFHDLSF